MGDLWVPPGVVDTTERAIPKPVDKTAAGGLWWRYMGEGGEHLDPRTIASGWWETGHREGLRLCVSIDDTKLGPLLHMSISHRNRYPTWDEIHEARDLFLPAFREFCMFLPRRGEYVNVHPNCFHLHEVPEALAY